MYSDEHYIAYENGHLFAKQWIPLTDYAQSSEPVRCEHVQASYGVPIILLHDSLGSVGQWSEFPELLAERTRRRVIAYDRAGFGKSSPRFDRVNESMIEEEGRGAFLAILKFFKVEAFFVFGHSVGGGMALHIAQQHQDRCIAVITEGAQSFVEEQTQVEIRKTLKVFENKEQFAKLEKWHGDKAVWVLKAWTTIWLNKTFAKEWNLDELIMRLDVPILILHGAKDRYGSPEMAQRILRCSESRQSQLFLYANLGHSPHHEHPERIANDVHDFLESVWSFPAWDGEEEACRYTVVLQE